MTCLLFSRWVNAVSHTLSNSFASLKTNVSVSTAVAANKILNKRCRYDSVARASVLLVLRSYGRGCAGLGSDVRGAGQTGRWTGSLAPQVFKLCVASSMVWICI